MNYPHLQAVILDWAGTAVDFGSRAPVAALQSVFAKQGVPVTAAEVREHMGLLKRDQIRAICNGARVHEEWKRQHGRAASEQDVDRIFQEFLPRQSEILEQFSAPIPGVPETIDGWRRAGLRIGSTTGYTRALLDRVAAAAAPQGYAPDSSVTPDEVGAGRPKPFMCYRNAILLGVFPMWQCVKIGDTPSDMDEGRNAGMWTIGITTTGNEVGLSREEWDVLAPEEQQQRQRQAGARLSAAGAKFLARSVAECTGILDEIDRRIASGEKP